MMSDLGEIFDGSKLVGVSSSVNQMGLSIWKHRDRDVVDAIREPLHVVVHATARATRRLWVYSPGCSSDSLTADAVLCGEKCALKLKL